jgi:hypothetical protein
MGCKTYNQNINIFLQMCTFILWLIAKTWLNFLMDDLEVDYKI